MLILLLCLCVPAALFIWRMCAISADADMRMESAFREMMREKESVPIAKQVDEDAR